MGFFRLSWRPIKWMILIALLSLILSVEAQERRLDSLLALSLRLPEDSTKVEALLEIGNEWQEKDYPKSEFYFLEALALSKKLAYEYGIATAHRSLGVSYFMQRDHPKAIEEFLESLKIYKKINHKAGIEDVVADLGSVYSDLGDFEKALEYFQIALDFQQGSEYVSFIYGHLSYIYDRLGNRAESERYADLSIEKGEKSNNPPIRTWIYIAKADKHIREEEYEEAKKTFDAAWKYIQDNKIESYKDAVLDGLATVSYEMGQFRQARIYINNAIQLYTRKGSEPLPEHLILLSEIYFAQKKYRLSLKVAEEVLTLTKSKGAEAFYIKIYELIANNHEALYAFEKANDIRKIQLEAQNTIQEKQNAEALAKLQTRFQIKEQEAENEHLREEGIRNKKELEMSQNLVRQRGVISMISILGLFFLSLLLLYVFRLLRQNKASNRRLEAQSKDLRMAKEKAESAAKAKSEFLSVMSHEIRTPMNAVIGMTEFLMDEEPREDQLEYLETLKFSGTNLIALINDILDFSKIEAGKLTLEKADMDLRAVVKSITASMAIKGEDKGLEVRYQYADELADIYVGDSVRLGQVLTNLMGNAVKFTNQGYVALKLSQAGENSLRFCVEDTGIGIPKEKQKKIFEAFSQAEENTTRKFGGTGLGLSISKRLVDLMGGELQIESEPGKGSKFFFEIILPKSEQSLKPKSKKKQSGNLAFGSLAGKRILVAEDNKINQMVARKFLEKWELEVTMVDDGQKAVEAWEKEVYDLILMDKHMPVLNGTEAT
ncbi:MAG: ATP-binding protein, partial [Bacteroidota bacterium]